jgi:hypothetical protein
MEYQALSNQISFQFLVTMWTNTNGLAEIPTTFEVWMASWFDDLMMDNTDFMIYGLMWVTVSVFFGGMQWELYMLSLNIKFHGTTYQSIRLMFT